ncbi:MAG: MBL fold metallo-hydrolase [Chloroflexota bacterium]|nr:MBL fold metallo-hydrolase [Chloroflexota bacterium]
MTNNPSRLDLRTRQDGPWPMNSYALICPQTHESVLIDPGAEPETLVEMLDESMPIAILLTHTHPDHVGALDVMRERLDVPVYAHPGPRGSHSKTVDVDRALQDGDTVQVGEHTLRVIHTPGHTDEMLSFVLENNSRIIVGDTIFEGGPGKTWNPEDFQTTLDTLRNIVLTWPDDTFCYPGHGPAFRLGDKRDQIEAFLNKDHGDFYGDAEWGM